MSDPKDVYDCDVCGAVMSIELHETSDPDDVVVFCPVCGEEMYEEEDDVEEEEFDFDE